MSYLPEVAEADARDELAELYDDVRGVIGLGTVNLIYRHFAATGVLAEVWAGLRPNLLAIEPLLAPAAPPGVVPLSAATLAAVGADAEDLRLARATFDGYERANSLNLIAMYSLIDGSPGTGAAGPERALAAPPTILPLADLRGVLPATRALFEELSEPITGTEEPRLVPSLLRHFAHRPALLALLWTAIRPATGELQAQAAEVRERARADAAALPYPAPRVDAQTRATCERFTGAMSGMLVTGALLRRALP